LLRRCASSAVDLQEQLDVRTRQLTEALAEQAATSEVLRVISSSPGELQPVFNAILENAVRICEANFGNMYLREGDAFRLAAALNTPPALVGDRTRKPFRPSHRDTVFGEAARTKQVVHVADIAAEQGYIEGDPGMVAAVELGGMRTVLMVPMLNADELVGVFSIYRQEVRPFTENQIALLQKKLCGPSHHCDRKHSAAQRATRIVAAADRHGQRA